MADSRSLLICTLLLYLTNCAFCLPGISLTMQDPLIAFTSFEFNAAPVQFERCEDYIKDIKTGIVEAKAIAASALELLRTETSFKDNNDAPWKAMRVKLFGTEKITKQALLIEKYSGIVNAGPGITFHCDMPPKAREANRENEWSCPACEGVDENGKQTSLDAFRLQLDKDSRDDAAEGIGKCGYFDGDNIVVCPESLPGKTRGFTQLSERTAKLGSPIEDYKFSYASMFVHEMSHTVRTYDYPKPYGYGFDAGVRLAKDYTEGRKRKDEANPGKWQEPGLNADSYAFFALANAKITEGSLKMADIDWTTGVGVKRGKKDL